MAIGFGLEKMAEAPGITAGTMMGWNTTVTTQASAGTTGTSTGPAGGGSGATNSMIAYLNGTGRVLVGGSIGFAGAMANTSMTTPTELNGGVPVWPIFVASNVAANTGWIGTRYDAFWAWGSTPVLGTTIDDLTANTRIIWVGTMMIPWSTTVGLTIS